MDLINMKVSHKIFGDGIIIAKKNSYITVKFCNDEIGRASCRERV